jgi:hypothetical protein
MDYDRTLPHRVRSCDHRVRSSREKADLSLFNRTFRSHFLINPSPLLALAVLTVSPSAAAVLHCRSRAVPHATAAARATGAAPRATAAAYATASAPALAARAPPEPPYAPPPLFLRALPQSPRAPPSLPSRTPPFLRAVAPPSSPPTVAPRPNPINRIVSLEFDSAR